MQVIEQPNGRTQNRNDEDEEDNAAFPALFPKRPALFSRSSVAVAFVVQRHRNVEATAAAEPPLEPPGTRDRSHGLRVTLTLEFSVDEPIANSSMLVLPNGIAPAARSF